MVAVDRLGLLEIKASRVRIHVLNVEDLRHLGEAEDVAVGRNRPAEQREVVEQSLGNEAAVARQKQIGLRITFRQFLGAIAEDRRQMGVLRNAIADTDPDQGTVQGDLSRRRRQKVLTAQHMGDPHQRIIDRVDQGIQRISIRPRECEVRHRSGRERRLTPDQIAPADVLIGHPQAQDRVAALGKVFGTLGFGEVAVVIVVTHLRITPGGNMAGLDLLGTRVGRVGLAGLHQSRHHIAVEIAALGLPVRAVRPTDLRTLIPVQPQPSQRVQDRGVTLLGISRGVGVLDAEHERPAGMPGVGPVEQRRAHQADVRSSGR